MIMYIVFVSVILLDQVTKYLAETFLSSTESMPLLKGIFHLTLVYNKGAAFGFFKAGTFFLIVLSFIYIALILWAVRHKTLASKMLCLDVEETSVRVALGLVLGGACGNLIDRLRFFHVVDFLDFRIWPVFNIADSALTIGGSIIFFKILMKPKRCL
jgi:signal peptidase II